MWKKIIASVSAMAIMASGAAFTTLAEDTQRKEDVYMYDVVVYGGNASGVIAAIKTAQMGKTVAVVEPNPYRIGGLTTGGLGDTDVGSSGAIGGMAQEFYKRVGAAYGKSGAQYKFEAKVALKVLQDWAAEYDIPIFLNERLDLADGVVKEDKAITSFRTESGKVFQGKMFLDCTYEGDLMAKAGVTYVTGRESNEVYNETLNGITSADNKHNGLPLGIDPYVIEGDPSSGLLPRVNADAGGKAGENDNKIQAYNFRWTLTNNAANRLETEKPADYNEADYEILFRAIEKGLTRDKIFKTAGANALPNSKMDANNNCGISTDYIGTNYDYPEGDYATRERIIQEHETYQRGLLWTVQNHPRVPEEMRNYFKAWGLCADEFTENNNWPTQLYVREARRMVSDFVMTQHVCKTGSTIYVGDSVGMGSYAMDSHHIQYVVKNGQVIPEGDFFSGSQPYSISYRSIVPKANECSNLLVPVCISASHAAYGSIRMEPVFMVLGQSAATAACIAIDDDVTVQNVSYAKLATKLTEDGQTLYLGGKNPDPEVIPANAVVYPIDNLATTVSPANLEYGLYDTAYAMAPSTKYNRVKTAKVGDYIEFEIDVAKPGTYTVAAQTYLQDGRATYKLYLPDEERYLGEEKDQYGRYVEDTPDRVKTDIFGDVTLTAPGKLKLRFEVTGKNASSKDYTLAFCNILLTPEADVTVKLNGNGGSKVSGYALSSGQCIPQPSEPTRDGYQFTGWYTNETCTNKWNFETDRVNENMTLYAGWETTAPEAYEVSFRSNYDGSGSSVSSQYVAADGTGLVKKPADPKRSGYIFKGWFADAACTQAWNFETDTVSKDTVLYAQYEAGDETDLTALKKAISAAESIEDLTDYTDESVAALMEALEAAKAITNADEQSAVDAATRALNAALKALKKRPDEPIGDNMTLLSKERVTSNEGHLILADILPDKTIDLTGYTGRELSITFKMRVNKTDNFSSTITGKDADWLKWIRNGHVALSDIKTISSTTLTTGLFDKITEADVWYDVTIPVSPSISSLNKVHVEFYNDLDKADGGTNSDKDKGVTFSMKDMYLVIGEKAPIARWSGKTGEYATLVQGDCLYTDWGAAVDAGSVDLSDGKTNSAHPNYAFATTITVNPQGDMTVEKVMSDVMGSIAYRLRTNGSKEALFHRVSAEEMTIKDNVIRIVSPLTNVESGQIDWTDVQGLNIVYYVQGPYKETETVNPWTVATMSIADARIIELNSDLPDPPVTDRTALEKAITDAEAIFTNGKTYTEESIAQLSAALQAAKTLADTASQFAIDKVTDDINKAIAALVEQTPPVPAVIYGDLNGDKRVTPTDALIALQAATSKITLTAEQTIAADVDNETGVSAADALFILQRATEKISSFPVESHS